MEATIALIYDSRIRALDSSGNPLVGATLTIYDAGTTTPSSIYRDAALATPMTNPTSGSDVSDSGGWFPQIFAAEGGTYDITLKTSGGVTVKAYVSVPALGTGSGAITRDFGTSRLRIANSGGTVRVEGGDPSGDDVGGKLSLGGYLGTQGDLITLDALAVNTTGTFTENSKKLPGVVEGTGSASASTTMTITVPNTPAGVMLYDLDIYNVKNSASSVTYTLRFSFDSGATYVAAANYVTNGSGGATSASLATSVNTSNCLFNARLRLQQPNATSNGPELWGTTSTAAAAPSLVSCAYLTVITRVTNIQITVSTGTMTGNWRVVPLRGTGDV